MPPGAEALAEMSFRPREWDERLLATALPLLGKAMLKGALSELYLTAIGSSKKVAMRLKANDDNGYSDFFEDPEDLPDWFQEWLDENEDNYTQEEIEELIPQVFDEWLQEAMRESLREIFEQDYWQEINEETRDAIEEEIWDAIDDGLSIEEIAARLEDELGDEWSMTRGRLIARTEISATLNEGHMLSMRRLEEEMGEQVGKEWLSVLGNTTRPEHAALDGVFVAGWDGLFNLDGYEIPYPGHYSLPAKHRCNCQCTILSAIVEVDED